ncbi:hypothetical protein [Sporomusa termitida]|uniref:hypothetical protein n=1 Tax=Sporomusa termitida TaxID=2377 RepID=UPI00118487C0|nr:hypothetical protein [Sporomusa termitida]
MIKVANANGDNPLVVHYSCRCTGISAVTVLHYLWASVKLSPENLAKRLSAEKNKFVDLI